MKNFPKEYAESTIKRMNKQLALPDETRSLLYDYFEAIANFYEVLPLNDAYRIFDRQNKGMVTKEDFIAFSEIARHERHCYYILSKDELYLDAPAEEPIDREIIHESLVDVDFEYYYETAEMQYGKPLCILPKEELLKYKDELYIKETPYTKAMTEFFMKELKYDSEKSEELMSDCYSQIRLGGIFIKDVLHYLELMKIKMTKAQMERFTEICMDMNNNTPLPCNRGFTPCELAARYKNNSVPQSIELGPNIKASIADGTFDAAEYIQGMLQSDLPEDLKLQMLSEIYQAKQPAVPVKKEKIGRNDPCPCGSGKKYKKCCGK
jgi:hypothetical protein